MERNTFRIPEHLDMLGINLISIPNSTDKDNYTGKDHS